MTNSKYAWWQEGIIYQIYPRSFQDSNNDGIGDIPGVIGRLDYLQWLGIDVVWLSPVYPSPMKDFGYDISDYTGIHPSFGTMDDFDTLVAELHNRGMKLIVDFVPNHTSDQHEWFRESRSSRTNSKRDWYIWADANPDGSPHNNWLSVFGGSAWQWDEGTGQYYYHAFLTEQPDLNYRNPEVITAMLDVLRFWLDKGVDGFRVDVMWHMIKDKELRNNPTNTDWREHMVTYDSLLPVYSTDQPEVHDIVLQMRKLLDSYNERMMIGEVYLPVDRLMAYYGVNNSGAHLPFNFLLLLTPWDSLSVAAIIDRYMAALPQGAWPNWVLGNHDQVRIRSRIGLQQARVAGMLLLTLPGTPTMYYGDELGMPDVPIPPDEVQDPQGLNMPDKNVSRDPARTPMQWDNSDNAGFSTTRPWLRIDKMYAADNTKVQAEDPDSMLNFYRRLIDLRKNEPSLKTGRYERIYTDRQGLAYLRNEEGADTFLIVLNLSHKPCYYKPAKKLSGTVAVATTKMLENTPIGDTIYLSGDEGIVVRLNK